MLAARSVIAMLSVAVVVVAAALAASAAGFLPPRNPRHNIAATPNFFSSGTCTADGCANPCLERFSWPTYTDSKKCDDFVLRAVDHARKLEGVRPMHLPTNWQRLTPEEQLFVLADLERVARGLPPYVGLNPALGKEARLAARRDEDPTLAPGFSVGLDPQGSYGFGGAWAGGSGSFSTLVADYGWMYDDGWGGSLAKTSNLACTSPRAKGCWAHRDELLGYDPGFNPGVGLYCSNCEMGTGFAVTHGAASYVDLVELPAPGTKPPVTFSWAKDVVPFLPKR